MADHYHALSNGRHFLKKMQLWNSYSCSKGRRQLFAAINFIVIPACKRPTTSSQNKRALAVVPSTDLALHTR